MLRAFCGCCSAYAHKAMELYAITDKEKRLKMDFEDLTKGFIAPKSFNLELTLSEAVRLA